MIRHSFQPQPRRNGFSIVELLVVTASLGILLGASIQVTQNALRREEGLNVVLAVAGWLEEIQRNAVRLGQQCTVTFDASNDVWTSKNPGERIASVTPENCAMEPSLLLPRTGFTQAANTPDRKPFKITIAHKSESWNGPQLTFTKIGSVTLTKNYVFAVQSTLTDNAFTRRCVRITQVVGTIGVGKLPNDAPLARCQWNTYDDAI